jgi:hypothetical protein
MPELEHDAAISFGDWLTVFVTYCPHDQTISISEIEFDCPDYLVPLEVSASFDPGESPLLEECERMLRESGEWQELVDTHREDTPAVRHVCRSLSSQ